MQSMGGSEGRNLHDTALSELDCEVFTEFYFDFLGKTEADKVFFLKGLTLMRQGQRRPFPHSVVTGRRLAEALLPTQNEREMMLTFPSTLESFWNMLMEARRNYPGPGSAPLAPIRDKTINYLSQIEISRKTLNEILKKVRPIQPKDKLTLSFTFAKTGELKPNQSITNHKLLLIILADHPFLCVLPEDAPSTMALGKLRAYINQTLGVAGEALPIEFFTIGGCQMKKQGQVNLSGYNPIFDVTFDNPRAPYSKRIAEFYHNAKFTFIYEILSDEFPAEAFAWEQQFHNY